MFIAPDGTITGSVYWAEVQRLVNDRDDKTVTKDGYAALQRQLDEHNGVLRDAEDEEAARAQAAAEEHDRALSATASSEPSNVAAQDYDGQTVEDLKAELKDRGLPTSGNKAELVERLTESDANPAEADNTEEG